MEYKDEVEKIEELFRQMPVKTQDCEFDFMSFLRNKYQNTTDDLLLYFIFGMGELQCDEPAILISGIIPDLLEEHLGVLKEYNIFDVDGKFTERLDNLGNEFLSKTWFEYLITVKQNESDESSGESFRGYLDEIEEMYVDEEGEEFEEPYESDESGIASDSTNSSGPDMRTAQEMYEKYC